MLFFSWSRLDIFLTIALIVALFSHYSLALPFDTQILVTLSLIALLPVLKSAWQSILDRQVAVDLLASIALIASLASQEWASAAFINLMLTSARIFGDYTARNARNAIQSLLDLKPKTVRVRLENGQTTQKSINEVHVKDLVIIGLGERIPIDGVIIEGTALIDQSSLTGESLPVSRTIGDTVLSSTLNTSHTIVVQAEKVGADTTLEKIIRLVEESQANKIGIQTTANRFANWYIASVFLGSILLFIFSGSHTLILSFLLIACADDLAIAIPLAFSAAVGTAAKRGIIIKGTRFLEGLAKTDTILFDKTGTLTTGQLSIKEIVSFRDFSPNTLLQLTASIETTSTHPIAQAITATAKTKRLSLFPAHSLHEKPGYGITASVQGQNILCGRIEFLQKKGVILSEEDHAHIQQLLANQTATLLFIAIENHLAGTILLSDTPRPEVIETIHTLKQAGMKHIVMLTGDNPQTAAQLANQIGIDQFKANLFPEDKVTHVKSYLNQASKVVMVGDGVNDAASLAQSDIGIAMGAIGSDTAIEAADVALMEDDLRKIPEAINIGRNVMQVARQNFWIWGMVNVIGLTFVFSGIFDPQASAAYNFLTDFIPIANSLRLFRTTQ